MSYPEYEQSKASRAPIAGDIERAQKYLSEYDNIIDVLAQKLESYLRPSTPTAVPKDDDMTRVSDCSALRTEIQVFGNRLATLNSRLNELVARIDT